MPARVIRVDARELRSLGCGTQGPRGEIDSVRGRVAGLVGGLDRRGWNAGAADGAWGSAQSRLCAAGSGLSDMQTGLEQMARLVDLFENRRFAGRVPSGLPLQDPVNSYTGNLAHTEVDIQAPSRGRVALAFARTYNSRDERNGLFGRGWTCSLEMAVFDLAGDAAIVLNDDGRSDRYVQGPDGWFERPPGVSAQLTRAADDGWRLEAPDGGCVRFSAAGRLERIGDANQNCLTPERDARQRIIGVVDGAGRRVSFTYAADGRLAEARDPLGQVTRYRYGAQGSLESVVDSSGAVTRYGYDARQRLVSIANGLGHTTLINRAGGQAGKIVAPAANGVIDNILETISDIPRGLTPRRPGGF